MNSPVSISVKDNIAVITVNNPPVNALSQQVREGLIDALVQINGQEDVQAAVLICLGKTFIAGADIKEFGQPPQAPHLPDVVLALAHSAKPIVAALHGTVLGGGCEVALACDYRISALKTKLGLPEVNLGLIPGAGGTQLLPRIVGITKAAEMIITGKPITLPKVPDNALIHAVSNNDLLSDALEFARNIGGFNHADSKSKLNELADESGLDMPKIESFLKRRKGQLAPQRALSAILLSSKYSLQEGMLKEREWFVQCRDSEQSEAMRYAFFAEKKAQKLPDALTQFRSDKLKVVSVIGAGTMGAGIAMTLLASGLRVNLLEINAENLERGMNFIKSTLQSNVAKGRMTETAYASHLENLVPTTQYTQLGDSELVIEAAFENVAVKKEIFACLEKVVAPNCILASNTSYLNIDEIAADLKHRDRVLGLHFFSPANIMKLLEIVKTTHVSDTVVAACMDFAKQIGKQPALVGLCYGFVGNRMYACYGREANNLLLQGMTPSQIDSAMVAFGMAMGPLAVNDMSGIDIAYKARKENPNLSADPTYFLAANVLVESGRLGQKTKAGFYRYDDNNKKYDDDSVLSLFSDAALKFNVPSQSVNAEQISERLMLALVNEGAEILREGIAPNAETIDAIWLNGYGFPRFRGGPMFYASQLGFKNVISKLESLYRNSGKEYWKPSSHLTVLQNLQDNKSL